MSATGDVTILDAARRRRYVLVRAVPAEALAAQPAQDAPTDDPRADHAAASTRAAEEPVADAPGAAEVAPQFAVVTELPEPGAASPVPPPVETEGVAEPGPSAALESVAEVVALPPVPAALLASLGDTPGVPASESSAAPVDLAPQVAESPSEASSAEPAEAPADEGTTSDEVDEGRAADGPHPAGPQSLPRAKQTLAYSAARAEQLKREFETSRSLSAAATPASAPPVESTPAASADADGKTLPRPSLQAVPPEQRGSGPVSSIPPAPKLPEGMVIRQPGDPVRPRRSMPAAPRFEGLIPLGGRDTDPSPQSPLTYRERSYLVARSADRERLEGLLQAQFVTLRRELVGKPRGQLIHLAVFDHSFDDRPLRPPIATLEWRDWRGNAVFVMAGEADPAEEAPAPAEKPRAPESHWPVPMRSQPAAPSTQVSRTSWPSTTQDPARALAADRSVRPSGTQLQPTHAPVTPFDSPSAQPLPNVASGTQTNPLQLAAAQLAEGAASAAGAGTRGSSVPPAATTSSWPVPPQTPLEPARVLAAAWPAAPQSPAPDLVAPYSTPHSETFPHASAVLAAADPFAPAPARPSAADVFGTAAKSPSTRPPASSAFGPPPKRPAAADVFAAVAARPAALDPFAPLPVPAALAPADPFGPPSSLPPSDPFPAAPANAQVTPAPQASDSFSPIEGRRDPTGENDSRLATAFEAMPDLYFLPTPVAGLEFSIQLINRLVPSEAVSGCLYDINIDVFRFVVLTGPGAIERRAGQVPSSAGLFGVAKRSMNESLVVKDAMSESRFDPIADGREGLVVNTMAYLPVRFAGQLLGMMQLINRANDRGFSVGDVAVLTYITTQLAEFLASRRSIG